MAALLAMLTLGAALSASPAYSYDGHGHDYDSGASPIPTAPTLGSGSIRGYNSPRNVSRTRGLSERLSGEQDSGRVRAKSYDYDSQLWSQGQESQLAGVPLRYRSYAIDANGSVEGLEDADGKVEDCSGGSPPPGCKSERYRYDPYGEQESAEGDLSDDARENPLRFEGFYYDAAVRTYDMHARPYRPEVGRFLSEDRFEAASGDLALLADPLTNNRYAFAGGNPVGNIEFDGHRRYSGSHDCGCSATEASERNTKANSETGELTPQQRENYAESEALAETHFLDAPVPSPDAGRGGLRTVPPRTTLDAHGQLISATPAVGSCEVAPCIETQTGKQPGPFVQAAWWLVGGSKIKGASAVFGLRKLLPWATRPANPATKRGGDDVADDLVVVRGGTKELPRPGEVFSGAAGRTLDEAASGVPHGQIRTTTARQIRAAGGTVTHAPELTRSGVLNPLHVNICLGRGPCAFGPLRPNPVPKAGRIR